MATKQGQRRKVDQRPDYLTSIEAERATLGGILIDDMSIWDIRTRLTPDDFDCMGHDAIFHAMLTVADSGKSVDIVTLSDELERQGIIDTIGGLGGVTGHAYIGMLPMATPTSLHAGHHASVVRDLSMKRDILNTAQRVAMAASDGQSADATLTKALTWFGALNQHSAVRLRSSAEAVEEFTVKLTDWLENPQDVWGLSTGIRDLDDLTGGIERGEFFIVAARPSMGKSALCLQIARKVAETGAGVAFFSLEMGLNQLMMRLACSGAQVNSRTVRSGKLKPSEKTRLWADIAKIEHLPIHWCCRSGITAQEATNEVAKLQARTGVALVVFDYIGLASASGENQNIRVSNVSKGLKGLAVGLDVGLLAASQLNRAIEMRGDGEPKLSDLRDSGSLEQDADKVLFIHRVKGEQKAKMVLAKNRNGAAGIGLRNMVFLEDYATFADKARG